MRNASQLIGFALVMLTLGGCAWFEHPDFRTPNWRSPGPAYYQQFHAVRHDPYPQDDLGPEIVGGRPRGYQKPPPEVTRARQDRPWGNWRGQGQ
jgi:hypothetical protein